MHYHSNGIEGDPEVHWLGAETLHKRFDLCLRHRLTEYRYRGPGRQIPPGRCDACLDALRLYLQPRELLL